MFPTETLHKQSHSIHLPIVFPQDNGIYVSSHPLYFRERETYQTWQHLLQLVQGLIPVFACPLNMLLVGDIRMTSLICLHPWTPIHNKDQCCDTFLLSS